MNNNKALDINADSFDSLIWKTDSTVADLMSFNTSSNSILETFKRIDILPFENLNIRFSDNAWDFSPILTVPKVGTLTFRFDHSSSYADVLKMYVLNDIFKKITKISTLNSKFREASNFISYAERLGHLDFASIPASVYTEYYESFDVSYNTLYSYRRKMLLFVSYYESNFLPIKDIKVKEYLHSKDLRKLKTIKEANKTPEIPADYLKNFVKTCIDFMEDESVKQNDRITAAVLVLYSQIGFRASELLSVKFNGLHEEYLLPEKPPLRYLLYESYKHGVGDNGSSPARTFINDLSYNAYCQLISLCKEYRERLQVDTLIVYEGQKGRYCSAPTFHTKYKKFMLRNYNEFKCINVEELYPELSTQSVGSFFKRDKEGHFNLDKNRAEFKDLSMDDVFVYPKLVQFRVTVCTNLYRQGVPLYYIKMHMNHLTEEMSSYYIRPKKDIEYDYSEAIYTAVLKGKSKLLGKNSSTLIDRVNEFIQSLSIEITKDLDEVIAMVSNKYPLRSKVGGICIRCGDVVPCASNDLTDEIYCAFGMCPNHCHMFFMADISYDEYLRHKEIVDFNRSNGFNKAAQKETNKLKYVAENSLLPELIQLKAECKRHGDVDIIEKYPQLEFLVNNLSTICLEVESWL